MRPFLKLRGLDESLGSGREQQQSPYDSDRVK
jgi:hypothetical protein